MNSELCRRIKHLLMKQKDCLSLPGYVFPSIELLSRHDELRNDVPVEEIDRKCRRIFKLLSKNNVAVEDVQVIPGPSVSLYKVYLGAGGSASAVLALDAELSWYLGAKGVRFVVMEDCIGIEMVNDKPSVVPLRLILESPDFKDSQAKLPVAVGYSAGYKPKVIDLADAPHILMAGVTKQGKSMAVHSLVASLLYAKHPSEVKFVFIDPKECELQVYSGLQNHYMAVLPDVKGEKRDASGSMASSLVNSCDVLDSLVAEMNDRLGNSSEKRPFIVVIIDEIADLIVPFGGEESQMLSQRVSRDIVMLAQKGHAAGIHLVLTTQKSSTDVITWSIMASVPTRMAFRAMSRADSMVIIDMPGAEHLIGNGDMIIAAGAESERVQGGFISREELVSIVDYVAGQEGFNAPFIE